MSKIIFFASFHNFLNKIILQGIEAANKWGLAFSCLKITISTSLYISLFLSALSWLGFYFNNGERKQKNPPKQTQKNLHLPKIKWTKTNQTNKIKTQIQKPNLLPLGCKSKIFKDLYKHLLLFGSKEKVVPNQLKRIMTPWTAKNGKCSSKLKRLRKIRKVQVRFMSRKLAIGMSYKISIYKIL